jgi:hypothetical protein
LAGSGFGSRLATMTYSKEGRRKKMKKCFVLKCWIFSPVAWMSFGGLLINKIVFLEFLKRRLLNCKFLQLYKEIKE